MTDVGIEIEKEHSIGKVGGKMDNIFIILAIIAILLVIILKNIEKIEKNKKEKLKELKIGKRGKVNGIIFGRKGRNKVVYSPTDAEGCVFVGAGTGCGKTASLGIPTLRAWDGTSFTIDISGDICKNSNMPNKLIFEPENNDTTPYNIFGVIDELTDVDSQNEALEQLAFLLMPEYPNMNDNSKFFLSNGRKILTSALIAFYHQGFDFIQICELIVGGSWQELFKKIDDIGNDNAIIYINSFVGASEQNTSGCKQSCDDALKLFATNAKIKNCVRRPKENEIAIVPELIEEHNIFIIVDDPKLALYAPLLNVIVSQQMQYISNRTVDKNSKTILLFLDEYASLHIDAQIILEALRKYRKRKCRLMILTQNLADFDILYGHDTTRALLANTRFKVLLGGLGEVESQKFFADLIGYKETKKRSFSRSSNSYSITETEDKEYIIAPAELDRMGDKMVLISPDGDGYMILKKNFYFKK